MNTMTDRRSKFLIPLLLMLSAFGCLAQEESAAPELSQVALVTQQLQKTISTWAGAWQAQLPDPYIAHYTADYFPGNFPNRDQWLADRRVKLTEPAFIKIRLLDFELVSLVENTASVRFTLVYERPGYGDETYKEMVLRNVGGEWLIEDEMNLGIKIR